MTISFARHQFVPAIIRHAVWLYVRFTLSAIATSKICFAERGVDISYETVAAMGFEVRTIVRQENFAVDAFATNGPVASRRDGRDDCGPAVLAVACS